MMVEARAYTLGATLPPVLCEYDKTALPLRNPRALSPHAPPRWCWHPATSQSQSHVPVPQWATAYRPPTSAALLLDSTLTRAVIIEPVQQMKRWELWDGRATCTAPHQGSPHTLPQCLTSWSTALLVTNTQHMHDRFATYQTLGVQLCRCVCRHSAHTHLGPTVRYQYLQQPRRTHDDLTHPCCGRLVTEPQT